MHAFFSVPICKVLPFDSDSSVLEFHVGISNIQALGLLAPSFKALTNRKITHARPPDFFWGIPRSMLHRKLDLSTTCAAKLLKSASSVEQCPLLFSFLHRDRETRVYFRVRAGWRACGG